MVDLRISAEGKVQILLFSLLLYTPIRPMVSYLPDSLTVAISTYGNSFTRLQAQIGGETRYNGDVCSRDGWCC